jgi:hypothetical protein
MDRPDGLVADVAPLRRIAALFFSYFRPRKQGSLLFSKPVISENIPPAVLLGQRYLQISKRFGEGAAEEGGRQGLDGGEFGFRGLAEVGGFDHIRTDQLHTRGDVTSDILSRVKHRAARTVVRRFRAS